MHFTCRSFLGTHDSHNWSQYWENEPDDPSVVFSRGHLFGLLSLTQGSASVDLSQLGHQLIRDISQDYFDLPQDSPSNLLKNVARKVSNLEQIDGVDCELVLLVICQQHCYLLCLYGGQVSLLRQGKVGQILSGPIDAFTDISGPVQPGDRFLLSTRQFSITIGWDQTKAYLAQASLQDLEESFISAIYKSSAQNGLAAAFIQIDSEEESHSIPFITPSSTSASTSPSLSPPKDPVYVSPQETKEVSRRRKINIIIALLLLIGLFVSVYVGKNKTDSSRRETQYRQFKSDFEAKLNRAQALKNLNLEQSQAEAKQAKNVITSLQSLGIHSDEVSAFSQQVNQILSETGSAESFTPTMFYDTSYILKSPQYHYLSLTSTNLYLLDSNNGRLDQVEIQGQSTKNIAIDNQLKSAQGLTLIDDKPYIFNNQGVYLVTKNSIDQKVDFPKTGQLQPLSLTAWNGALYLLDGNTPTIYKFTPNNIGFGEGQNWVQSGQTFPSNPTSLAINGKIWVLASDGLITPFVRGLKDNYKTPSSSIKSAKNLTTSPDGEILAFVDSENIVYVYRKNGDSQGRYNFGDKKIFSLVLDSSTTHLYALCSDQKIYVITL